MGTGPFDSGTELEAARLLRGLSDYTSTLVRQEVLRAQLQIEREHPRARQSACQPRVLVASAIALLGSATLVAAAVMALAGVLRAPLAALVVGTALFPLALAPSLVHGWRKHRAQKRS